MRACAFKVPTQRLSRHSVGQNTGFFNRNMNGIAWRYSRACFTAAGGLRCSLSVARHAERSLSVLRCHPMPRSKPGALDYASDPM